MWLKDQKFLVAAFVLHLALPVAAAMAPDPHWRRAALPRAVPQSVEIDVEATSDAEDKPESEEPPAPDTASAERPAVADASTDSERPIERREPEEVTRGAEASPDRFPSPDGPPSGDPMGRPPSLYEVGGPGTGGLGTLPFGVLPTDRSGRNPAPTETHKRTYEVDAAQRSIDRGLRVKDAQLGLDFPAASAIAAVLREAVRAGETPFECQGSFTVTVSASGRVTAISLGGYAGGDPATWQIVRKHALAQLSSRVFEMKSSFSRGALVGVTVRSEQKMPGGGVGRQGASLSFDVADVGAKPMRVVSMSFTARPLE